MLNLVHKRPKWTTTISRHTVTAIFSHQTRLSCVASSRMIHLLSYPHYPNSLPRKAPQSLRGGRKNRPIGTFSSAIEGDRRDEGSSASAYTETGLNVGRMGRISS